MDDRVHTRGWSAPAAALLLLITGPASARAEKVKVEHEVTKGESLIAISERYGVSVDDIIKWNDQLEKAAEAIEEGDVEKVAFKLRPGMVLKLPGKPSGKSGTVTYKVKKGDSLWAIGKQFHVKQSVIIKWNKGKFEAKDAPTKSAVPSVDEAASNLKTGMLLKVPGKPSGATKKVVNYKVKKGDSLWSIGKQYNVKPKVLVKWNPEKLGGTNGSHPKAKTSKSSATGYPVIHPGMKLLIHALRPDLGERVAILRVRPGETAKKIANRYEVDYKLLMSANFILPKDKLKAGMVLEVPLSVTKKDTQSVGAPHAGKLFAGEKMPTGPGWIIKQPQLAYGTSETINQIVRCIGSVQKKYKNTPDIVIGHLSKKLGGKFKPHKSHASGRDVDIGYYHTGIEPKQFVKVNGNLDANRTNHLIECLVDSGNTQYIFIDTYIQKALYHNFKKRGFGLDFLTKVFQYPQPEGKQLGIIRHEKGHDDHMHVRFFCPEGDKKCHD